MGKSLLTSKQVDSSIVKTSNLDSLGFLTKNDLSKIIKAGPGIKIDYVPMTLALFHCDNTDEAIIDSINNIKLCDIGDPYMPNYAPIEDGKFSKAIIGANMIDASCLNHYEKDESTGEYIEQNTYLNCGGNYSVDFWLNADLTSYGITMGCYLGCAAEGEYEPYQYILDGNIQTAIRITPNEAIYLSFYDVATYQELATFELDSSDGFNMQSNTWHHFAFQKVEDVFSIWFDGMCLLTASIDYILYGQDYVFGSGISMFNQMINMDELRITQDNPFPLPHEEADPQSGHPILVADDFTPETAAYPDSNGGIIISAVAIE